MSRRLRRRRCECAFYADAPAHHDELLSIERASFDVTTHVVEMAVTWHELEYGERAVVQPQDWLEFVECHEWQDRDRVRDFFIALQSLVGTTADSRLALVVPLRAEEGRDEGLAARDGGPTISPAPFVDIQH